MNRLLRLLLAPFSAWLLGVALAFMAPLTGPLWAAEPAEKQPGTGSSEFRTQEVRTPAVLPGDQTLLLITLEGDGSRIEEVRYGGVTQSINVSPKGGLPPDEVQTTDGSHSHPVERSMNSAPLGARRWNLFDF